MYRWQISTPPISYIIREMQIKTTMSYHYTLIRIQTLTTSNVDKDVKQLELSFIPDRNAKWYGHFWRKFDGLFIKPNALSLSNQAITFFGIYSKELKTYTHTKTYKQKSITTLYIIAKTWKPLRCSSVSEWVNCDTSTQWNSIQH